MAALFNFSEEDVTLAEMEEYLQAAIVETWDGARLTALAQFCLDVTETE
jgi:hypothetical protein